MKSHFKKGNVPKSILVSWNIWKMLNNSNFLMVTVWVIKGLYEHFVQPRYFFFWFSKRDIFSLNSKTENIYQVDGLGLNIKRNWYLEPKNNIELRKKATFHNTWINYWKNLSLLFFYNTNKVANSYNTKIYRCKVKTNIFIVVVFVVFY